VTALQSFWFGEGLSPYERLAMKSFLDFGHSYTLYAYRKFDVPKGVELRDAAEILPESRVFVYKREPGRGSVAAFSNLFRYRLLREAGGWWVDADVICLAEKIPEPDVFLGWEEDEKVGSAILRFPARHPLPAALYRAADAAGDDVAWGEVGPHLVTRLVHEVGLEASVLPRERSFPIRARNALDLLVPSLEEKVARQVRGAPMLHYWNEILRRAVVFKWMAPPPESFMGHLFRRHGIEPGQRAYGADEIERLRANFAVRLNPPFRDKMEALRKALAAGEDSRAELSNELRVLREDHERLSHRLALAQRSTWHGLLSRLTTPVEPRGAFGIGRAIPQTRAAKRNHPG
jgi:hypothetical protein